MSASATAILMTGAVPVFADIEDETFGLDPASVEAAITPHTRGIMVTNIFGHPARLSPLRAIADKHQLFLIEDCAQSPGALYRDRETGTIGHMGVFSFNRHKTMQSGEGGVVITNDDDLALRVALFRNHGEVVVDSFPIDDITNTAGLNLRMTEMEAAVARVQLARLEELTDKRIGLIQQLIAGLTEIPGITPPTTAPDCKHVYYVGAFKYDDAVTGLPRDLFTRALGAEGFPMRAGYVRPLYLQPVYQQKKCMGSGGFPFNANPRVANLSYAKGICPVTERLQDRNLMLTDYFFPPLTQADMGAFVEACHKVLGHRDDLLAARKRGEI
jgi:dTDP-4-amino-4,6-dideoxygalactose transaminase